ncbi:CTP synthase [Candidatus Microgenomates bacterium]|nr:CTP synthase [Candidatus Microgenomates bacterium]
MTKFIFVSGGVISGVGKGITTASLSLLLKSMGFKVSPVKADPYLNVDAGTMNPIIHGETFVTEDGLETDQDLGHYERFLNENLSRHNYMTAGQVFSSVIQKERRLDYDGICVETVPHVPEEILRRLEFIAEKDKADFVILEIGGTVGEYQNMMFLEAARELKFRKPKDVLNIHVAYLPLPPSLGELKSKPVQTSVHLLQSAGIQPDIIIGRAQKPLDQIRKEKISTFCNVSLEDVFSNPDLDSIYEVPLMLESQGIVRRILKKLGLKEKNSDLKEWKKIIKKAEIAKKKVKIGIVGKYFRSGEFSLEDSYICVIEAIKHGSWWNDAQPEIVWIDSLDIEEKGTTILKKFDGLIVPQGWGTRGIEGKIKAIQFARENKVPYLGLCFGMQLAIVEFARHVCQLKNAHTQEADPDSPHLVIHLMPDQEEYLKNRQYGGTIRLGAWPCKLLKGTQLRGIYEKYTSLPHTLYPNPHIFINERHRHRYECNQQFKDIFEENGMVFSGISPDGKLIEAMEIPSHPFFIGTQFHPELKSKFLSPHPIFLEFIKACFKK